MANMFNNTLFESLGMTACPEHFIEDAACHFHIVNNNLTYIDFVKTCNYMNRTPEYLYCLLISFVICHILEKLALYLGKNLNIYKSLNEDDRIRYPNKIVSYLHAIISTALAVWSLLKSTDVWAFGAGGFHWTFPGVLGISVGYFIYDLLFFFRMKIAGQNVAMVVHHILCIVAMTYNVNYRIGLIYNIALLFTEVTTPLYHHRWFFLKLGMGDSLAYKINGLLFWILFFCLQSGLVLYSKRTFVRH
ncbi:hypothetical protein AKO1_013394 [Acrasis kona]|uniref:TLC domain-containing protein n=1 Tax=Acrasis kona TaxID=1008807 RepID=A0AAW2YL41_9EUKA